MTERAKLHRHRSVRLTRPCIALLVAALGAALGCRAAPAERASGVYAHDTRDLVRIDYDYDADGRIDVRTYMRDGRPVRLEGDANGDGVIDRWEYYDGAGTLARVGASSLGDGRQDTWVSTRGGERLVEISTRRDGTVDRREIYRADALVRVEADTNHDGLPDRWEEFRGGALARLLVDEERRHGRPTRRLTYDGHETTRIETDADGDGAWEPPDAAR